MALLTLQEMWHAVLFTSGGVAVTVRSVSIALLLIGIGYVVAGATSTLVTRILSSRVTLEPGAANAINTLSFYGLFMAFCLASLSLVNFPLTVFTLAGGAVAIGVGFGSQNVMNNFISGLILLFERPLRAGDLVSVEGTYGTVERIGARSTLIRAPDNTHMIVPNSFLVENSLINYTLTDDVLQRGGGSGLWFPGAQGRGSPGPGRFRTFLRPEGALFPHPLQGLRQRLPGLRGAVLDSRPLHPGAASDRE
ncbi:MAG: mechanosensitive ion channel domain-containing protein [Vicinamibacteria bacterium]